MNYNLLEAEDVGEATIDGVTEACVPHNIR
jgi:hypothetical protein